MKISVIVSCLKRDGDAERCLSEIVRQASGEATLDLVVVDGVSPVGKARNEGLRRATGDYVAWVDADDGVSPGWWHGIVSALGDRPDVLVFDCTLTWPDGRKRAERWGRIGETAMETLVSDVLRGVRLQSWLFTKVIRRELLDGLRFDESVRLMEDFLLLPHALRRASRVKYLPESLYDYRQREGSLTHAGDRKARMEAFRLACRRAQEWDMRVETLACASIAAFSAVVGDVLEGDEDSAAAIAFVRRHLVRTLADADMPVGWKAKFFVCALGKWAIFALAKVRRWKGA